MEIDKKELTEKKQKLEAEIIDIQKQLAQARQIMQQNPIALASRKGQLALINELLKEEKTNANKPGTCEDSGDAAPDGTEAAK